MADGTDELVHALTRLLSELIREATRLSVDMAERRAERLRRAAQEGERAARAERARLAGHRAADAAIWRRTADPVWWRKATPEQLARAWRAASTWHQVDPEAAGARRVMADRLRRRGVEVDTDRAANPGDARWLQTALDLAQAEREEQAAFTAERDSDVAVLADEVLWDADELPRKSADAKPEERRARRTSAEATLSADEVLWAADELTGDELARRREPAGTGAPATDDTAMPVDPPQPADTVDEVVEGELMPGGRGQQQPVNGHAVPALTAAPDTLSRGSGQPEVVEGIVLSAVATEPDAPRRHSDVDMARMEAMLRQAWPDDKADRVLEDGAWPGLASTMQRLDRAGKNVPKLLRDLPIDTTTDVKVPAVLTAWTLRAAAAGPATLGRALRERERHQRRTAAARHLAEQPQADSARDDEDVATRRSDDIDPSVATLLATAFPTTTRESLNRKVTTADSHDRPGTTGDRAAGRHPVTADRER